ncbi:hypothetical protein B0H14DRAFT_3563770, partial [Mycena olivaceomarginata]
HDAPFNSYASLHLSRSHLVLTRHHPRLPTNPTTTRHSLLSTMCLHPSLPPLVLPHPASIHHHLRPCKRIPLLRAHSMHVRALHHRSCPRLASLPCTSIPLTDESRQDEKQRIPLLLLITPAPPAPFPDYDKDRGLGRCAIAVLQRSWAVFLSGWAAPRSSLELVGAFGDEADDGVPILRLVSGFDILNVGGRNGRYALEFRPHSAMKMAKTMNQSPAADGGREGGEQEGGQMESKRARSRRARPWKGARWVGRCLPLLRPPDSQSVYSSLANLYQG